MHVWARASITPRILTSCPATLALCAALLHARLPLAIALIWINHIGVDRLLGYGLKYSEGFGVTHLGRLGKPRPTTQPQ